MTTQCATSISANTATERALDGAPQLPALVDSLVPDTAAVDAVAPRLSLEAGLHAAFLEARRHGLLVVRLLDGRRTAAEIVPQVSDALVDECLAEGKLVLVSATPRGPAMIGAIQTTPTLHHDREGVLTIEAKKLHVKVEDEIRVVTGANAVVSESHADGRVRLRCERGAVDFAANLRVHSALVELP